VTLQIRYHVKAVPLAFDALKFESHLQFILLFSRRRKSPFVFSDFSGIRPFRKKTGTRAGKLIDSNYTGAVSILNHVSNAYAVENKA